MRSSFSATSLARSSCTKRTAPLITSMKKMIQTVLKLFWYVSSKSTSVPKESHPRTKRMTENGLTKALRRQWRTESCLCAAGALLPYFLRRTAACLSVRPFESNASSRIICSTVMQAYRLTLSCTASRCDISPSPFTKIFLSYHIWQVINLSFFLLLAAFLQLAM